MAKGRTIAGTSLMLRALVAVALLLAAFAHRPAAIEAYGQEDLTAYVLPDGTLPVLCLPGDPNKSSKHFVPCDFCQIASTFALPAPSGEVSPAAFGTVLAVLVPSDDHIPDSGVPPSARPRGPPSLLV